MKISKYKIILFFLLPLFIYSCQGAKDALQGKRRSDNSDEFLVEKKNPLTMPPDYNELPVPIDQEQALPKDENDNIKELLEISKDSTKKKKSNNNNSLEDSILEKISD